MFRLLAWLICCAGVGLGAAAQDVERAPLSPVDMIEIPKVSDVSLSPDGRYLLHKVSRTDWSENKIVRRYVLLDIDTGETITAPNPEDESDSARDAFWHPESLTLLFLKRTGEDDLVQVFEFDLSSKEITQLTRHHSSVIDVYWGGSPDHFFFTAAEGDSEKGADPDPDVWSIRAFDTPSDREVWKYDYNSQTSTSVLAGDFSVRNVEPSKFENEILYVKVSDHTLDAAHDGDVFVLNLETGQETRWTENDYRESDPVLSPDGRRLAYIATVSETGAPYYEDKVFVQAFGEAPRRLLGDMPMEALAFAWDRDGQGLYILGNTGLRTNLYHYALEANHLRQITKGDHSLANWTYARSADIHVGQFVTAETPGELSLINSSDGTITPVTNVYADLSKKFQTPVQEPVSWKGRRGVTIEGLLVYPIDYVEGQRYPLVTITHGGPRSSSQFGSWNTSRYVSVLAGQGYLVFLPNHRGGTGYGDKFMRDMAGRYFRNAHHDVMDGIDALIERGLADPDRLIKMGWSAGGHMVNKLITHTDRFKAASSGAGAADWLSMHGESDARHNRTFVFGGDPWSKSSPRRQYTADSPLKDVWKVTTPTLFFAGEEDIRVPPTQSILMHRGVRATGTPTAFYLAKGEPHNFRAPAHQLFKINTELAWYARFALGEDYEPVLPQAAFEDPPENPEKRLEIPEDLPSGAPE